MNLNEEQLHAFAQYKDEIFQQLYQVFEHSNRQGRYIIVPQGHPLQQAKIRRIVGMTLIVDATRTFPDKIHIGI